MTANNTPPGVRLMTDGGTDTFEYPTKAQGIVTRDTGDGETDLIKVPISSTRSDREGDRFAAEALEGMADQIREQQPMVFDNHGLAGGWMDAIPYDARETIGAQVDAEVTEDGDGEHTLHAFINPDESHPEGERLIRQVRDEGQPVKFSVGFGINEADAIEDEAGNEIGREFLSADLMETSRVGIPANPDASVDAASAKDAVRGLPGYRMHPIFARMMGLDEEAAAKGATPDGGGDVADELEALREENADLRQRLADMAEETKGPCDDNGDCPEGEVCVDGECVPEDEVDDEEDAADPEAIEALQARIDALEEELREGRGDPKTTDTATEEPDLTETGEPDATDDTEPDERADHEYATTR